MSMQGEMSAPGEMIARGEMIAEDAITSVSCPRPMRPRVRRDLELATSLARAAFGSELVALLLVGGYARGEGGAMGDGPDAASFNDYDLVAVVRRVDAVAHENSREVSRIATERVGIEVDVWPISAKAMKHPPATLFWLDVALGGVVVLDGDEAILAGARKIDARAVPLEEAARLLVNRATGLALSRLEGASADPLRTAMHVYKAVLACGDARLLAASAYEGTVRRRGRRLEALAAAGLAPEALASAYCEAADFRLRPHRFVAPIDMDAWLDAWRVRIAEWHAAFETYRLGAKLTIADLVRRHAPLYPKRVDGMRFGLPAALRAAVKGRATLFPYVGHPRERLARASIALAYLDATVSRVEGARWLGLDAARVPPAQLRDLLIRLRDVGS